MLELGNLSDAPQAAYQLEPLLTNVREGQGRLFHEAGQLQLAFLAQDGDAIQGCPKRRGIQAALHCQRGDPAGPFYISSRRAQVLACVGSGYLRAPHLDPAVRVPQAGVADGRPL